jgi:hypothetical protein
LIKIKKYYQKKAMNSITPQEEISKPGDNHKFNDGSDTTVSHDIDRQDNDSSSNGERGRGRGRGFRGNRGRGRNFNDNERNNEKIIQIILEKITYL